MKPLKWPTNSDQHAYMAMRQVQNRQACKGNRNENWMADKLKTTSRQWTRQAQWGYRLFDFWCGELGVAIEVDGPEHHAGRDSYRDEYNFRRSAIVVLRVRNGNEEDAARTMIVLETLGTWEERRKLLGLDTTTKQGRRLLVGLPVSQKQLPKYIENPSEYRPSISQPTLL